MRQTETGLDARAGGRGWQGAKSRDAFRTITEVASELDLPQHVLRFWETKFPQIKPVKRRGGRRYYRPEDIAVIRGIRSLLYVEGYTIKGVQKLLRENGKSAAVEAESRDLAEPLPLETAQSDLRRESPLRRELEATLRELEELRELLNAFER